jgi:hypothetical protein
MPTPTAQDMIQRARNGEKLTTRERRHVITWLQATSGDDTTSISMTNQQLGDLFGVTERTIRQDKQAFRKEKAKFIREDDISLIIADIALDFERQSRDIERSKKAAKEGSMTYLRHCTDALLLRVKMVNALQDLGYYPKNLGQLTVNKWDFEAKVDKGTGYVTTEQVTAISHVKELPLLEAEVIEIKEEKHAETTAVRSEYEFTTTSGTDSGNS